MSHKFDIIFHVAAKAGIWGSYKDFYESNFVATQNLLEEAKNTGVKKFIYTSTPSVVFGKDDLMGADENIPYPNEYLTHYASTKAMAEKLVLTSKTDNFKTCAIRPHLIWGPGDPHIFPRLLHKGKERKLKIIGDGENLVDITYIENAAQAHLLALKALDENPKVNGSAYFIGQERPIKLWEFINQVLTQGGVEMVTDSITLKKAYNIGWAMEKIWKMAGIISPEPPMTRFVALNLGKSHYFSHEKAKVELGYQPIVSIEEGMKMYFLKRENIMKLLTKNKEN